jgi:predicted permease
MEPALGRGFEPNDTVTNAAGVAVISDSLWRHQFSGDPGIVGRPITLGNHAFTIVGVARPQFKLDEKVDVWTPLSLKESAEDQSNQYNIVARLRPGLTAAQVADDMKRVLLQLKDTYPALWNQYESVRLVDFHESLVGNVRPALEILMGAVLLLLAIVAANILSLLLTRSIARRREMGLRAALGASGWRILRQLLAENVVLCAVGGIAGLFLAQVGAPALMSLSPLELPQFSSLEIGTPALLFTALLTVVCALLFSVVPAIESRRTQLNDSLKVNTTQITAGRHFAQKALVISEVAISLVLLVGAALLLNSFWKLMHTTKGFDPANVLTFKTAFSEDQAANSVIYAAHLDALLSRIEAMPGVESASAVNNLPTQLVPDLPFDILGRAANRPDASGDEKYIPVTAHYFDSLRIPVVAGRSIANTDTHASAPVVVINEQFVRNYFKNENPLGQHIRIGALMGPDFADPVREIVGVVGDVKQAGLDGDAPGILYLPVEQVPDKLTQLGNNLLGTSWIIRTKSPNVQVAEPVRRLFVENAQLPLLSVQPLADVVNASLAQQRFNMLLLSGFGFISLLLGCAGLYGVMSYTVARQRKEIGVRMAIGAQRSDILFMVLREAGVLVVVGLVLGIATAIAGARLLQSLVFGIAPRDPKTLIAASAVLLLTGLFAAWFPAQRAASTEPMQALRSE